LVNTEGFPLRYEIFAGNTFEGKIMMPVLRKFRDEKRTEVFSVVADAAMMALENLEELKKEGLTYIVGARMANLSPKMIDAIAEKLREHRDGDSTRIPTPHGDLIASFSSARYLKDKKDMEHQIEKAKKLIAAKEPGKRAKFVKKSGGSYAVNDPLIEKTTRLLGIKGYYTNIPENKMNDAGIIVQYKNLWRVEQSFLMSKSDLVARPIYLRKEDSIKAHLVICFMALAIGKYMELKTGFSLRRVTDLLKQIQDARIINMQTKEEVIIHAAIPEEVKNLFEKLSVSY
jgi:transposase